MERPAPLTRRSTLSRRGFLELTGGALGLTAATGCASSGGSVGAATSTVRRVYSPDGFDPWIEIDRAGFAHNVRGG